MLQKYLAKSRAAIVRQKDVALIRALLDYYEAHKTNGHHLSPEAFEAVRIQTETR